MPPTLTQQPAPQTPAPAAAPVTPAVTPQVQAQVVETTKQPEDILKRVSQKETPAEPASSDAPKVSVAMEDIKDPVARQILEKRLAEANESISKTFGQVGADKAKLMKQVEELQGKINQSWTPQRLQQELARQDFVQSAQALQAQAPPTGWDGTQAEWSSLTASEKQQFQNIVASQQTLTQQMNHMLQSQVDAQLKTQYPDYDPTPIDAFYRESLEGRVPTDRIREMIYKALNYENHVKRAYGFAMQDKTSLNQERVNGMTPQATPATLSQNAPEKLPTETTQQWLSRKVKWTLGQVGAYRAGQKQ